VKSDENSGVTVIIPTFRSENVIIRALNSVLIQTSQPDEIIVVDDASDDQTVNIVREFAKSCPKLQLLVNTKNEGPGRSRNTAWQLAKTEFIAFLDADDTWQPEKLQIQLEWFKNNQNAVICGTKHKIVNEPTARDTDEPVSTFDVKDLLRRNRFTTPSAMLRRNIPVRFDNKLRLAEDYLLWMEIAATYGSVNRINQALTILHKPIFGASGLSSKMFPMYIGELKAINALASKGHISRTRFFNSACWSTLKLIRRTPTSILRNLRWRFKSV
jgi:glycosyltransferase involved in cell wall biosynthesis